MSRRRLLGPTRGAEHRSDAAEREQLERDRRRSVCSLERLAERASRFVEVVERQCGKADPAEGCDRAPPVVDLAERLVAGPTKPQRLLEVRSVSAEAGAAQRVAGATDAAILGKADDAPGLMLLCIMQIVSAGALGVRTAQRGR